jgi:hypothetical protein
VYVKTDMKASLVATAVFFFHTVVNAAFFDEAHYNTKDPRVAAWWSIMPGDVPTIKVSRDIFNTHLCVFARGPFIERQGFSVAQIPISAGIRLCGPPSFRAIKSCICVHMCVRCAVWIESL